MRGELSEALDRLARRDEALRRRAASEDSASAAEDLVAAARRLVDRHPDVSITLTIERGQTRSSVRLVHGQEPYVIEVGQPYQTPPSSTGEYDYPSGGTAAFYDDQSYGNHPHADQTYVNHSYDGRSAGPSARDGRSAGPSARVDARQPDPPHYGEPVPGDSGYGGSGYRGSGLAAPRFGGSGRRDPADGGAPTAGVRPVDLAADEAVVLDAGQPRSSPASRLADLLREYPAE
jgi:hypothetical protein